MLLAVDYEILDCAMRDATEQERLQMERALAYARSNLTDGYDKELDDFVIITVEGYKCIAAISDYFEPIRICTRVFPFDAERIYPMQEIETEIYFKTY